VVWLAMVKVCVYVDAFTNNLSGNTHCKAIRGNVCNHNSIRPNNSVVSNNNWTHDLGSGADIDAIAYGWHAKLGGITAYCDTLVNVDIVTHMGLSMDYNAEAANPSTTRRPIVAGYGNQRSKRTRIR
jgi:hypothetical protein